VKTNRKPFLEAEQDQPLDQSDLVLTIIGHELIEDKCLYHIEIAIHGASRVIKKRFSDVSDFITKLGIKGLKPPPKRPFMAQTPDFIQKRKEDLHAFFCDLLQQKNIATNPEFIDFFEIKILESKRKDHFYVAQQQIKQLSDELSTIKTDKATLENEMANIKKEFSNQKEKLFLVEQHVELLHEENTKLLADNELLRTKFYKKETQLDNIREVLQKLLKEYT